MKTHSRRVSCARMSQRGLSATPLVWGGLSEEGISQIFPDTNLWMIRKRREQESRQSEHETRRKRGPVYLGIVVCFFPLRFGAGSTRRELHLQSVHGTGISRFCPLLSRPFFITVCDGLSRCCDGGSLFKFICLFEGHACMVSLARTSSPQFFNTFFFFLVGLFVFLIGIFSRGVVEVFY